MTNILLAGGIVVERQYFVDTIAQAGDFRICTDLKIGLTSKVINGGRMLSSDGGYKLTFLGTIGQDQDGEFALSELNKFGFDTSLIVKSREKQTGKVAVLTNSAGLSANTVFLGANELTACPANLSNYQAYYLATSLPLKAVYQIIENKSEESIILLDAPNKQQELDKSRLKNVDFLIPNRLEAQLLTKEKITSVQDAFQAAKLLQQFTNKTVIITLDKDGCILFGQKTKKHIPGPNIKAVDTTGAGDIFRGIFLRSYLECKNDLRSAQIAVKLASQSIAFKGVYRSIQVIRSKLDG